jgi:hypothetical protein
MDGPWNESDEDQPQPGTSRGGAYPIPEATIAGDPSFLAAVAAAILGVLLFWRKKKSEEDA